MIKGKQKMLLECPNCSALWGMEEIDWQECDACGWPDCDDHDEYNEDEYDVDDWDDERDDPNDSRNI